MLVYLCCLLWWSFIFINAVTLQSCVIASASVSCTYPVLIYVFVCIQILFAMLLKPKRQRLFFYFHSCASFSALFMFWFILIPPLLAMEFSHTRFKQKRTWREYRMWKKVAIYSCTPSNLEICHRRSFGLFEQRAATLFSAFFGIVFILEMVPSGTHSTIIRAQFDSHLRSNNW